MVDQKWVVDQVRGPSWDCYSGLRYSDVSPYIQIINAPKKHHSNLWFRYIILSWILIRPVKTCRRFGKMPGSFWIAVILGFSDSLAIEVWENAAPHFTMLESVCQQVNGYLSFAQKCSHKPFQDPKSSYPAGYFEYKYLCGTRMAFWSFRCFHLLDWCWSFEVARKWSGPYSSCQN